MARRLSAKICVVLVGLCGVGYWAIEESAERLVSPPRRALQEYHRDWLEHPAAHGIRIERVSCLGGTVPCLLVTPDATRGLSERGGILRRQVAERGYFLRPFGEVSGNLVLLHGRKGRKEDLLPVAERFCAVGFRCLIPDLPAHGESPIEQVYYGAGESEGGLARQALLETVRARGLSGEPAGIWGISMGGAFAARALSVDQGRWDCGVIVSSFDSLDTVIREQGHARAWVVGSAYSRVLQHTLRRRHGLDPSSVAPATWLEGVGSPVLVAHGTADSLFSLERGRTLLNALPGSQKRWVEVTGGGHNDVLITPMPLYATMATWYLDHMSPRQTRPSP